MKTEMLGHFMWIKQDLTGLLTYQTDTTHIIKNGFQPVMLSCTVMMGGCSDVNTILEEITNLVFLVQNCQNLTV